MLTQFTFSSSISLYRTQRTAVKAHHHLLNFVFIFYIVLYACRLFFMGTLGRPILITSPSARRRCQWSFRRAGLDGRLGCRYTCRGMRFHEPGDVNGSIRVVQLGWRPIHYFASSFLKLFSAGPTSEGGSVTDMYSQFLYSYWMRGSPIMSPELRTFLSLT